MFETHKHPSASVRNTGHEPTIGFAATKQRQCQLGEKAPGEAEQNELRLRSTKIG